jgi:hypothetical protein
MDTFGFIGVGIVFAGGLFAIACCIMGLSIHSQKGQVLFDLLSWPHHGKSTQTSPRDQFAA